jgi:hypothetical protein
VKFFQKTQSWLNQPSFRRIQLSFAEGQHENAIDLSVQPGKLSEFDSVFYLDVNRQVANSSFIKLNQEVSSYIFRPATWLELTQAVGEVSEYIKVKLQTEDAHAKTTLVLNDWQSAVYLFNISKRGPKVSPSEFLFKLKLLSDCANIILIHNQFYDSSSFQVSDLDEDELLAQWANLCLKLLDDSTIKIEKSALLEWPTGQEINLSDEETPAQVAFEQPKPETTFINKVQALNIVTATDNPTEPLRVKKSLSYDALLLKLADAKSRQDLLAVRKEIQAVTDTLTGQEKLALSDIYRIHLQRIKLVEDNFLSQPLNMDVG